MATKMEMLQGMNDCLSDLNTTNTNHFQNSSNKKVIDVLILGAGLAGLGAAKMLSTLTANKKCSFTLLEAQSMPGGRVKTVTLLDFPKSKNDYAKKQVNKKIRDTVKKKQYFDGGAQWLHGRHNFLHKLAERYQLLTADQSEEGLGSFLYENGIEVDGYTVRKIDFKIGLLLSECEQYARQQQPFEKNSFPKSVGHFLREKFDAFIESIDNINDRQVVCDLFDWHQRFQVIDNSCLSLDYVSAKYWGRYSFNGEQSQAHYNFKSGFGTLVDQLVNELNDDCIHYNKEVTEIRINDSRTELNHKSNGIEVDSPVQKSMGNISVKCADGSVFTANHVLVTFSLGVLKLKHEKLFQPNLPVPVQQAIESLGFGTINKIFLEFEAPWWKDVDGIQFLFNELSDADSEDIGQWIRGMTGFDVLKPNYPNVLLGWVGANGALEMEKLSDDQIVDDCVRSLSKFTNLNVPKPIKYFCTRWRSNPFIRGAYSYISTDCDYNDTISESMLSRTLTVNDFYGTQNSLENKPKIFLQNDAPIVLFAGEACHDKFFSTAHGAFLSGMEQAQKFLDFYD